MRLRTIRTQQPPGDARLSGIALAHGAVCAQFAPGVRVNHALDSAGTLTEAYGSGGRGLYLAGSGTAEIVALPRSIADTWTLIALVDWAALGTLTSPLDCDSTLSGFTRVFQFRKTAANKMEVIRFNTGGSPFTVTTVGAAVTGKPQFIAMRSAGLSYSVTLGTETVSGTMTGTARSLGSKLLVGAGGAGGGGRATAAHNGRIYGWVLFDKFLDASDLMDYAANFWIAADAQRTPTFYSAGGGAYTLTADAGTYSVSAADAGMRAARRLSANAGSYSVSAADAGMRAARRLTADAAAYAYSGAAAGLYVGRRLTADAAAYSATGSDAVLSYSGGVTHYTMTADAGSFAVTGSAASLLAGRKLVAAAGSYSVGGQTAAFARAYRLTADATSYSVSLNAATLTYSGAGSLLWTPQTPGAASWVAQSAGPATWTPQ